MKTKCPFLLLVLQLQVSLNWKMQKIKSIQYYSLFRMSFSKTEWEHLIPKASVGLVLSVLSQKGSQIIALVPLHCNHMTWWLHGWKADIKIHSFKFTISSIEKPEVATHWSNMHNLFHNLSKTLSLWKLNSNTIAVELNPRKSWKTAFVSSDQAISSDSKIN